MIRDLIYRGIHYFTGIGLIKNIQAAGQQGFINVCFPHKAVDERKDSQFMKKAIVFYNFGIRDKLFFGFLAVYLHPFSCILFQVTEKCSLIVTRQSARCSLFSHSKIFFMVKSLVSGGLLK